MASQAGQPATFGQVVGLVNKLQQICTQLGDTAGNSILVDKLSSIVVVGGQVRAIRPRQHAAGTPGWPHRACHEAPTVRGAAAVPGPGPPPRPDRLQPRTYIEISPLGSRGHLHAASGA